MDLLTISPFALLLLAVLGLWIHRAVWIAALVAAVPLGYYTGALQELAGVWIIIAAALAWGYSRARARATSRNGRILQFVAGIVSRTRSYPNTSGTSQLASDSVCDITRAPDCVFNLLLLS